MYFIEYILFWGNMKRIVIYYCASSGVDVYLYQKCKNPFLLQYS